MFGKIKLLLSGKKPVQDEGKKVNMVNIPTEPAAAEEESKAEIPPAKSDNGGSGQKPLPDTPGNDLQKLVENPENKTSEQKSGENRPRKRNRPERKNDPARDFYRFLNQAIKTMHNRYTEGKFDDLDQLGKIPRSVLTEYDQIMEKLPEDQKAWISTLRSMLVLREEEGAVYADIADRDGLKKEFLNMMLPFYSIYGKKMGEGKVRFSSLIGPEMLKVFHELTGKKFSVGFHRRYENGDNAFEWDEDRYRVYDSRGRLLCDAVFKDGLVDCGYAELAEPDPDYEDWEIVKAGQWKDGLFQDGAVRYAYRIEIN